MKNAMQLKAVIKNISAEKGISAQLVMQNFMLERLLERISLSSYRDHFILKGGFLIAAMVGLDSRATMDMDATIKGIPVSSSSMKNMFHEICNIKIQDIVTFAFVGINQIRSDDEYGGYRISLTANVPPVAVPLKLDITTGDKITPKEMSYQYKLMMEDRRISILAYNLETVLAEKLETIISRSDQNTRPRDFYDVYVLQKLQNRNIDFKLLRNAIVATSKKRNTEQLIENYRQIISVIEESEVMTQRWNSYQNSFSYANDISFQQVCDAVVEAIDRAYS